MSRLVITDTAHSFDDSAAYERFIGSWGRAAGEIFLDWVASPSGAQWLDVGFGAGLFTQLILDTHSPAAVFAIDQARAQIEHARGTPAARRANFQVGDAQALPFPDTTFDIVASALVINFIPDRLRALSEMRRVARTRASSPAMYGISERSSPQAVHFAWGCETSSPICRRCRARRTRASARFARCSSAQILTRSRPEPLASLCCFPISKTSGLLNTKL
jgi:ubiquinone/menaquinone biosynthesis C-methylase UbiE